MEYPKQHIPIYMYCDNGNRAKGMFYMNGGKPTFVSYGTEISDRVIGWEYVQNEPRAARKLLEKNMLTKEENLKRLKNRYLFWKKAYEDGIATEAILKKAKKQYK